MSEGAAKPRRRERGEWEKGNMAHSDAEVVEAGLERGCDDGDAPSRERLEEEAVLRCAQTDHGESGLC